MHKMDFEHSAATSELIDRVRAFVAERIEPHEAELAARQLQVGDGWQVLEEVAALKRRAREAGLWNLFLSDPEHGFGLSNVDYAPLAEAMGRTPLAPEIFNCTAPDTGNMALLLEHGSDHQKRRWLQPLLDGTIRSAFAMTEPDVASSDATNINATAEIDGDRVILNGRKWWSTGAGHPDCAFLIFMGVSDPDGDRHRRHSMVLVPKDTPGVTIERMLAVFGYYDPPYGHGEVSFDNVELPADAVIGKPGAGFAMAQGRLGPGRIHHCMRLLGAAEKALELMCRRGIERQAFGRPLAALGGNRERIAAARIAIDQARLLVLNAAWRLDRDGARGARREISQIKVAVPAAAEKVIDMAIQLHGGAGLSDDFPLAALYTQARTLRIADGPDEVHRDLIARLELRKYENG